MSKIVRITDMTNEEKEKWNERINSPQKGSRVVKISNMTDEEKSKWNQRLEQKQVEKTANKRLENKNNSPITFVKNIENGLKNNTSMSLPVFKSKANPIDFVRNSSNSIKNGIAVNLPIKLTSEQKESMNYYRNKRTEKIGIYNDVKKKEMKKVGKAIEARNEIREAIIDEIKKEQNNKKNFIPQIISKDQNYNELKEGEYEKGKIENQNIRTVTPEESKNFSKKYSPGDVFKITNGAIDDRDKFQKGVDNIVSPIKNIAIGIPNAIASTGRYMDEGMKQLLKKSMSSVAENYIDSDTANTVSSVLGDKIYDDYGRGVVWVQDPKKSQEVANKYNEYMDWSKKEIQDNINRATNPISRKLAELGPSVGQNIVPMAVGLAPIPGARLLSTALFMMSAGGNYLDDAKERGMNDDEAFAYATVMGSLEGASEGILKGQTASKIKEVFTRQSFK